MSFHDLHKHDQEKEFIHCKSYLWPLTHNWQHNSESNLHTLGAPHFKLGIGTNGSCSQWPSKLDGVLDREVLWVNCLRYLLHPRQWQCSPWQQRKQTWKRCVPALPMFCTTAEVLVSILHQENHNLFCYSQILISIFLANRLDIVSQKVTGTASLKSLENA